MTSNHFSTRAPRAIARVTSLIPAFLLLLLSAPSANGQAVRPSGGSGEHLLRVGVAGGVVVPTAAARGAFERGVHAEGFLLLNVGFPLRINLGYQKFNLKQAVLGAPGNSGTSSILGGGLGTQIHLFGGPVRPYITAGLGAFDIRTLAGGSGSGSTSASQTRFGVDGGAGIAVALGRLSAFVEGRVQNVYSDRGVINAKSIQAVPVSFGFLF